MTKQNILIVEPNPAILESVAKILLPEYQVSRAYTQHDGFSAALGKPPILLISHLPQHALMTLLTNLAQAGQAVPVILMVDSPTAQISVDLLRLGVKSYVTLPVKEAELWAKVNQVLGPPAEDKNENGQQSYVSQLEFADMASHLLRNPLNVIQTSVRCLQTLDLDEQEQNQLYKKIWDQSQRLSSFTTELLQTLQDETDTTFAFTSPVVLAPVIERMLSLIQDENPHLNIQLVSAAQPVPPVVADATKTEIVLFNMLTSAVRQAKVGSTITVVLSSTEAEVTVTIEESNGKLNVENAVGMVFQPFAGEEQNIAEASTNFRMAANATNRLVKTQNGRLWGSNLAGQGSQLMLSLPIWR
ncbi:MAG: sensor histidine kinase [Chloroflexi bacterium]|nr:MAG: sensor histidine kinase [Chloroflexota bacterium]